MDTNLALFGADFEQKFGESETEAAVRLLIEEIQAKGLMTPARRVLCTTASKLARIIEQPKSAIAAVQAAAQLTPLIEKIIGDDTHTDDLPEELKQLFEVFQVESHVNE